MFSYCHGTFPIKVRHVLLSNLPGQSTPPLWHHWFRHWGEWNNLLWTVWVFHCSIFFAVWLYFVGSYAGHSKRWPPSRCSPSLDWWQCGKSGYSCWGSQKCSPLSALHEIGGSWKCAVTWLALSLGRASSGACARHMLCQPWTQSWDLVCSLTWWQMQGLFYQFLVESHVLEKSTIGRMSILPHIHELGIGVDHRHQDNAEVALVVAVHGAGVGQLGDADVLPIYSYSSV